MKSRAVGSKIVRTIVRLAPIVVCIPLLYLFGIFFRGHIIPFYVNTFYRGSVNKVFADSLSSFNNQLSTLGFDVSHKVSTCYNGLADNSDASFSGIRETVLCSTTIDSTPLAPNTQFIAHWKRAAPNLQALLASKGWQVDTSSDQNLPNTTLANIFDNPTTNNTLTYNYRYGTTHCQLNIQNNYVSKEQQDYEEKYNPNYNKSGILAGQSATVTERCEHYVNFFGGSGRYAIH